jgi:uncharacterized protein (TIGR02118 family)
MVKMTFCLRRLSHLSREEFQRYWRETHGPLVRERAATLRIRRYVQSHTLSDELNDGIRKSKGLAEGYDGVAELWWDSLEELGKVAGTAEGSRASGELFEDEKRFIDHATSCCFLSEDHALIGD